MKPVTGKDRLRYMFDKVMTRGTRAKIGVLGLICLVAVVLLSLVAWLLDVAPGQAAGNLPLIAWKSLLRLLDPGTMGNDAGAYGMLMLIVTGVGIFITASLIAIINNGIQDRLNTLRKGRSKVIENNHVVILGWSEQIFTVINELMESNRNRSGAVVVIMCDQDPIEMEDAINSRIPDKGNTRVICRQGDTTLRSDFEMVSLDLARAIVVLSGNGKDFDTIKMLLAIVNNPDRKPIPYHVVTQIRDPENLQVAKLIGKNDVEIVMVGDFIARIIAQTCRQPGLSLIYSELLDFEGDEIYFIPAGSMAGSTFGETLSAFENSTVIGIIGPNELAQLNPPMDTPVGPQDRLISIQADKTDECRRQSGEISIIEHAIREDRENTPKPENTVILGWNDQACTIICELDQYIPTGSTLTVATDIPGAEAQLKQNCVDGGFCQLKIEFKSTDITKRTELDRLGFNSNDHIVLLADNNLSSTEADSRTLATLINLRDIAEKKKTPFSIVSEMKDIRTRDLARVTRVDDFIVSDKLVSLAICQICENKHLAGVLGELFNSEGSEIYLKPASDYVRPSIPINFFTVIEAARRRGEVAIGYKLEKRATDSTKRYGVVLNPCKSSTLIFHDSDRIIVLAES